VFSGVRQPFVASIASVFGVVIIKENALLTCYSNSLECEHRSPEPPHGDSIIMARPASSEPTHRELEILQVLWQHGPATLGTICEALRSARPLATTTVATMLKVMLDKRLAERRKGDRGYLWSARATRDATASGMLGRLADRVFDGSAGRLVAHLMEDGQLTADELAELRQMLDGKILNGKMVGVKKASQKKSTTSAKRRARS